MCVAEWRDENVRPLASEKRQLKPNIRVRWDDDWASQSDRYPELSMDNID